MEATVTAPGLSPYRRLGDAAFWAVAALAVFLAYLLVMKSASRADWLQAVTASLINLLSLALVAAPVRLLILRYAIGRDLRLQLALHVVSAPVFGVLWYWIMMVLIGLSGGASAIRFDVRPFFADTATAWQLLQGVTVYALLAALTQLRASQALPSFVIAAPTGAAEPGGASGFSRYFIRRGEEIFPVDVSSIVSIAGADDYAEVATTSGRHLVRMTLGDFEQALESGRFIRVHRSHIVNVDRIERAEPAGGGRLLLHMENGEIVQASRTGTRLLRDRVL